MAGTSRSSGTYRDLLRAMFTEMVVAKDLSKVEVFYDPDFALFTNGQVQDYRAFHDGHARVYPTDISYSVEYDDDAWVEGDGSLGARVWITTQRPGEDATRIEVILLARYRGSRILRLWELTWPDWSTMTTFETYSTQGGTTQP